MSNNNDINCNNKTNLLVNVWKVGKYDYSVAVYNESSFLTRIIDNYYNSSYISVYCAIRELKLRGGISKNYYRNWDSHIDLFYIKRNTEISKEEKTLILIQTIDLLNTQYRNHEDEVYDYLTSRFEEELFNFE